MSAIATDVLAGGKGPICSASLCMEPAIVTCDGPGTAGADGAQRRHGRPLCRTHATGANGRDFCDPHVYVGLEELGQQRLFE